MVRKTLVIKIEIKQGKEEFSTSKKKKIESVKDLSCERG